MEKIIHYCWFGGKPLPKLAKKCIKSWKKYLPDYKIIEWNENNFDVNVTRFSKQAYDAKKWAFVSDVARIYALKEYGGIYFDTDMIVTKDIKALLEDNVFAGWESEYNVAVGVLGVKNKNNALIEKIWDFYCTNDFSLENIYSLSIPTILSRILKSDYGLKFNHMENQLLKDGVKIYARDYFYPIGSDGSTMFTERTCMIHYYIGSWLSSSDTKRIKFEMALGKKLGNFVLNILVKGKAFLRKTIKIIFYPYFVYYRKKNIKEFNQKLKDDFDSNTKNIKNNNYIAFYNPDWLGTSIATKELFDNVVGIPEIFDESVQEYIADYIVNNNFKMIIFSAFANGWPEIIKKIKEKNPKIIIKVVWHGSNALLCEYYDWLMLDALFNLYRSKKVDSIGFVKKSLYEFYKAKGYNVEFIYNTVHIDSDKYIDNSYDKDDGKIKIGIYSSGNRWVKNFYNQFAAASLFENAKIDCVPIDEKVLKMANIFEVPVYGLNNSISREELLKRMAKNDINLYVTFTECAPLTPLESLDLGVVCITGDNHHYWQGTELEKYLVVTEEDDCIKIYEKAKYALEHKDEILELYKKWKIENDKLSKTSVNNFLKI